MSGYVTALVIGGATGLVIGLVLTVLRDKPAIQLRRARKAFQETVRQYCPTAKVSTFGGVYVHPVIWIATTTDAERDKLRQDSNLIDKLRAKLLQIGYSAADIPLVQFVFESQETVDSDFGGSWSRMQYVWHRSRY